MFLLGIIFAVFILFIFVFITNQHISNDNYTNNLSGKKTLVAHYSHSSRTKNVANMIKEHLNCDIEEITSKEYENLNLADLNKLVTKQMQENYIPKTNKTDISNYNIIFVGTPVWKGSVSLPVKSFLKQNSLSIMFPVVISEYKPI